MKVLRCTRNILTQQLRKKSRSLSLKRVCVCVCGREGGGECWGLMSSIAKICILTLFTRQVSNVPDSWWICVFLSDKEFGIKLTKTFIETKPFQKYNLQNIKLQSVSKSVRISWNVTKRCQMVEKLAAFVTEWHSFSECFHGFLKLPSVSPFKMAEPYGMFHITLTILASTEPICEWCLLLSRDNG